MIYLDNAATTKPCREAVEAAVETARYFGNPSSLHRAGMEAEKIVEKSRECIASKLGVDKNNLYFTSGGTEANNTAILGSVYANRKRGSHVITTAIEHPSVLASFKRLEEEGFSVTYLKPGNDGVVAPEQLENAMTPETVFVSVMHVNNETGMTQPVQQMAKIIKDKSRICVFHSDMVQSFGKIPARPKAWGIDMASVSAHKIHGLKGVGALYMNKPHIKPLILGGEQQKGIRPGTENVAGIAAFGAACAAVKENSDRMHMLRSRLRDGILNKIGRVKINGDGPENTGNILNVSFLGTRAEILLHSLERHEIYVSTGSACSSHKPQPSHVLTAMGLSKQEVEGAVRFSFDEDLTEAEIDRVIEALTEETEQIRKYVR